MNETKLVYTCKVKWEMGIQHVLLNNRVHYLDRSFQ